MDYVYNDYELVYLVKEESEEAVSLIMDKYEPIIKSMASYYIRNNDAKLDYDDLLQEGRLGLLQAIRSFDEDKNVLFYTFAILCIKGKMLNHIKYSKCIKNYPLYNSCEFDDTMLNPNNLIYKIDDELNFRYLEEKMIDFKNNLNFSDALIFELKLNAFSYNEISTLLDIDKKKVDNRLLYIRKKLKIFLLNK